MADLRVAILGYGLAGSTFHAPLIAATAGLSVAAIVTGDDERAARARAAHPDADVLDHAERVWEQADRFDVAVIAAPSVSRA